jgi:hypothetical protein
MSDEKWPYKIPLSLERSSFPHCAVIMPGFDSVTIGNDEYLLLTPHEYETGEIREYFQLPNDQRTLRELMDVIGPDGKDYWVPFGSWLME